MDRLYDPRLFPLPHPVRTDAVLGSDLDARVFQVLERTADDWNVGRRGDVVAGCKVSALGEVEEPGYT